MKPFLRALLLAALTILAALADMPADAQNPRYTVNGSITTSSSIVAIPSRDYDIATVTIHGTYAGIAIVFEFSDDGSTWYQDTCTRSDSPVMETGETVASNATLSWDCGVVATLNFRVRSTAWTSGTATLNITMTQDPLEPAETTQISSMPALPAGTNAIGYVSVNAASAGGGIALNVRLLSAAASTNATLVKSSVGRVYKVTGYNAATSVRYLKIYNKSSAPTVGTDTPVITLALAPGAAFEFDISDVGFSCTAGIGFGLTVNPADSDTTALTAGDIVGLNFFYS